MNPSSANCGRAFHTNRHYLAWAAFIALLAVMLISTATFAQFGGKPKDAGSYVGQKLSIARKALEKNGYTVKAIPYPTRFPSKHQIVFLQKKGTGHDSLDSELDSGYLGPSASKKDSRTIRLWYYDLNVSQKPPLPAQEPTKPRELAAEPFPAMQDPADSLVSGATTTVLVPPLSGMSREMARNSLESLGLDMLVGSYRKTSEVSLSNKIAGQIPVPGTIVPKGTTISVTIYSLESKDPILERIRNDFLKAGSGGTGLDSDNPDDLQQPKKPWERPASEQPKKSMSPLVLP